MILANFFALLSALVSLLYPSYCLPVDGKGKYLKLGPRKALFHGCHGMATLLKLCFPRRTRKSIPL